MAQGTGGVTVIEATARREPRAIEEDITRRRGELTALVGELNRRRHALTDVRLQLRRHPLGVTVGILAVVAAVGALTVVMRRARHRTILTRGARRPDGADGMIDRPERVAVEPTATQRILGSAGSAVATFVVKAALERYVRPRLRA